MYRIAQEALNNVARHAKATEVWVDLRQGDDGIRLEIGDDGRGFDAAVASAGHFGLRNMRERAEAIGARFRCRQRRRAWYGCHRGVALWRGKCTRD